MSNNGALAGGAFITSLNGKRCTAVPKSGGGGGNNNNNNNTNDNNAQSTARVSAQINTAVLSAAAETTTADSAESTTLSSLAQIAILAPPSSTTSSSQAQTQVEVQAGIILPPVAAVDFSPDAEATSSLSSLSSAQTIAPASSISSAQTSIPVPAPVADPAGGDGESSPIIPSSEADDSNTATLATVPTSVAATVTEAPLTAPAPTPTDGGAQLFSTIGTDDAPAAANTGPATNNVISTEAPAAKTESVAAVAGGVVGGVALIGLVAFLVWFFRRRTIKRRRSTMLTPLDGGPGAGSTNEKGEYVINRGSIGPTPRGERIKASFDYNIKRIRSRFSQMMSSQNSGSSMSASVNMNRGNSQFMEDTLTRRPTNASSTRRPQLTARDRLGDWWSRVTADANFSWRMRNGKNAKEPADPFAAAREKTAVDMTRQPDFLTLLSMDERELDREAQKKRANAHPPPPSSAGSNRSFSDRSGGGPPSSALSSSAPHFLSDLNLGFGGATDDPFSDAHALAHNSAKPAPLAVSGANNPFSDANAIGGPPRAKGGAGPSTYIADMRRSRGQSVGGAGAGRQSNQPGRGESMYRESVNSVDTYTARRNNKFRSDPFDLERPELLLSGRAAKTTSSNMSTAGSSAPRLSDVPSSGAGSRASGGVGAGDVRRPRPAHQRSESFTSKYSSGFSLGDWSDPGPDVGPAAIRWGETGEERNSGGSQGSVGKAL